MDRESSIINLDAVRASTRKQEPFPYTVISSFLRQERAQEVYRDFPEIHFPGSFPPDGVKCGASFQKLLEELEGPELRSVIEEKFGIDLKGRPTLITIRGRTA